MNGPWIYRDYFLSHFQIFVYSCEIKFLVCYFPSLNISLSVYVCRLLFLLLFRSVFPFVFAVHGPSVWIPCSPCVFWILIFFFSLLNPLGGSILPSASTFGPKTLIFLLLTLIHHHLLKWHQDISSCPNLLEVLSLKLSVELHALLLPYLFTLSLNC